MITKLQLKNFRGIKEGEIELAPLTILLGGNNSGKSTILEALFLAPNPFRKVPYVIPDSQNSAAEVIQSLHETLNSAGYAFLLYNYTAKNAEIRCVVDGEEYLLQFVVENSVNILVSTNKETGHKSSVIIAGKEEKVNPMGTLNISLVGVSPYPNLKKMFVDNALLVSAALSKSSHRYVNDNWVTITNLGIAKKVAEDISGLVYDKYKDITIEPWLGGKHAINGLLEDGRRIRLGDLGEGFQIYVIAKILYELEQPKVLLWDDIEAHLNPRMLLSLAEWFFDILEKGDQVIVTTHSLEAARTIAGVNEEKAAIYLTALEKGVLKTRKFKLQEIEEYLEAGIDVRVAEPFLL
ncbi:MAG: AAA family ATPase [Methanophagales archaeon]|nr:AAA family ATPase [Methanophagales archaeon]